MPAIISSFISNHGRRGRVTTRETDFDSICGDVRISSPTDYASKQPDSYVEEIEEEDEDLWGMPRSEYKNSRNRASLSRTRRDPAMSSDDLNSNGSTLVCNSISPPLPQLEQSKHRSRSQTGNAGERKPLPITKRASSSTRVAKPKVDVSSDINDADAHAFYAVTSTSRAASPVLPSPMEEKARPMMTSSSSYTSLVESAVVHRVERTISPTDQRKAFQFPLNNLNSVLERETRSPPVSLLSPVCEGFDLEDTSIESRAVSGPTTTLQPVSKPQNDLHPTDHITSPGSLVSSPCSTFDSSPSFSPRPVQSSSFHTHHEAIGGERRPSKETTVDPATVTRPSPSESEMAYSPPSEVNAFPRPSSRAGPGLGATSIMRPSSSTGNRHRRSVSCGPTDGRYFSTAPGVGMTQTSYDPRRVYPEQTFTSPQFSDDSTQKWSPRSDESAEYQGESPKRLRSQAALDSPDPTKRQAFSPPLGTYYRASPEPTYYNTDSDYTHTSASTSASTSAGSGTSKPASHGNIYTELEHDLRFVARELSHAALVDKQQRSTSSSAPYNDNSKRNQLRNRARSATRGIGIGISIGGSDKDRKRSGSRHRAGSLASSASASAAVAAARGVPAYEPDMSRLNGSSMTAYSGRQELVPEYDDLWC